MIGKILGGRYEIIEKIGEGGMAEVYKAKCHLLNRYVAVKILKPEYAKDETFVKTEETYYDDLGKVVVTGLDPDTSYVYKISADMNKNGTKFITPLFDNGRSGYVEFKSSFSTLNKDKILKGLNLKYTSSIGDDTYSKRVLNMKYNLYTDVNFDILYEIYDINDEYLVMVVSDRISAFDVILPEGVPYKGQVLNQIASKFLDATADIVPNWKIATPDPMVTVGHKCEPFKVEMVIRGYLTGSSWRAYKSGERTLCGLPLPEGMRENQKFDSPLITPTTKADEGHDENISKEEIIAQGLVSREDYELMEKYTYALFQRGTEIAAEKGLILVDTKYEFGKKNGRIYLIDEIHTPDSSRYFYAEGYEERFAKGEKQKQLSKEFVREWLMDNGFQGQAGQKVPEMTPAVVAGITDRYIELYEHITGQKFVKADSTHVLKRIEDNVNACLKTL